VSRGRFAPVNPWGPFVEEEGWTALQDIHAEGEPILEKGTFCHLHEKELRGFYRGENPQLRRNLHKEGHLRRDLLSREIMLLGMGMHDFREDVRF